MKEYGLCFSLDYVYMLRLHLGYLVWIQCSNMHGVRPKYCFLIIWNYNQSILLGLSYVLGYVIIYWKAFRVNTLPFLEPGVTLNKVFLWDD